MRPRSLAISALLGLLAVPMIGATISISGSFNAPITITSPKSVVNVGGRACTVEAQVVRQGYVYLGNSLIYPLPPGFSTLTSVSFTTKDRKGLAPVTRVVVRFTSGRTVWEQELAPGELYFAMPAGGMKPMSRSFTGTFRESSSPDVGVRGKYEIMALSGGKWSRATIPSLQVRYFGF